MHVAAATSSTRDALDVRNSFMEYFISDEGLVEWPKRVVNRELVKILVYTYFLINIYLLNLELAFYNKN